MRLQFSDDINLTPHFAQWLECLTEPAPERRFTGARQALSTLKSGGESVRKPGQSRVRYDHQDGLTFRDRVRYGRLAGLTFLQFIVASIAISLIVLNFLPTQKTPEPDACEANVAGMTKPPEPTYSPGKVTCSRGTQLVY